MLEKAKLTDPTPLTSSGESIEIQHACINRSLYPCILLESYLASNLWERTNGQVEFVTWSFPELGLDAVNTLYLIEDGTLDSATVSGGYVGGQIPAIEIQDLWGMYSSQEQEFEASQAIIKDIERLVLAEAGGVILSHNWYAGVDQFLFCRDGIGTPEEFAGKKTRSHAAALSDWLNGMGALAVFVAFAEAYTTIEREVLNCGVTHPEAAFRQRWYEVTDYMIGPLVSFPFVNNVINRDVWRSMPDDLQRILIEEAAKSELEQLRLASIQNLTGLQNNLDAGIELVEFSPEIRWHSFDVALKEHVIPGWLRRLGYPGAGRDGVDLFNDGVGPYVGLRIDPDGSVVTVLITKGPHEGKTMEEVLSE